MQLSIDNTYIKSNVTFVVKHNDEQLEFTITPMVSKRNKDELDNSIQFLLINKYLEYKGVDFQNKLFNTLKQCNDAVMDTLHLNDIYPLPYHIVYPILDMLDLDDIFKYLKYEFKLPPPSNLADTFDVMIEKDGRGSRVQTYLKDDYLQLAALTLIIKVAMLPIFTFAYIKQKNLSTLHREYMLFHLFRNHPIFDSEPMRKLEGLIEKLIYQNTNSADMDNTRILEKQIPKDELSFFILGLVIIQKVSIAPLVDDNVDKNIITKIYNYVTNKLKPSGDVSKSIRNKTFLRDSDGGGESESLIESHRTTEKLDKGILVELDWSVNDINKIIYQMPKKQKEILDMNILKESEVFCKQFMYIDIQRIQLNILSIIFKTIIDPRSLDYVKIEGIVNLLSVAFAYLWGLDCKVLALILVSKTDKNEDETIYVNSTVNKTRLTKEIKDELDFFYPYKRVINNEKTVNVVEESIINMANMIYSKRWLPICDSKYLIEGIGSDNVNALISSDIKLLLAEFIVKNERIAQYE